MTPADRALYVQSLDLLRPFKVPLNVAVLEYTAALNNLPPGATLKEAVDFFRKRSPAALEARTFTQVVEEMLAAKRAAKLREVHLKDLESRLGRLASDFQMNIGGVSTPMLRTWLDSMDIGGRTKRNYLMAIGALFRFAAGRKYLPKDAIEEIEAVQQAKEDNGEIEIFTPAELAEILAAARPEMIPWLTIAGFAGLRSAEIARLDWSAVKLSESHIEIKASKAKTAARRLAPITDHLRAWLASYAKPLGRVAAFDSWWNQLAKLVEEVNRLRSERGHAGKFAWKHSRL